VAATIYFQNLNDAGSGIGRGEVWGAAVHRIDFPGSSGEINKLNAWLNRDVIELFQDGLIRFQKIDPSV